MRPVILAIVFSALAGGAGLTGWWLLNAARTPAELRPATVELGQFAAPITRVDGVRGHLLVQARAQVDSQDNALALSRDLPAVRHAALRAVHALAAKGEANLSVDVAAAALTDAVNTAFGGGVAQTVYIDRLLVQ